MCVFLFCLAGFRVGGLLLFSVGWFYVALFLGLGFLILFS